MTVKSWGKGSAEKGAEIRLRRGHFFKQGKAGAELPFYFSTGEASLCCVGLLGRLRYEAERMNRSEEMDGRIDVSVGCLFKRDTIDPAQQHEIARSVDCNDTWNSVNVVILHQPQGRHLGAEPIPRIVGA
jgi:hypothetical protein